MNLKFYMGYGHRMNYICAKNQLVLFTFRHATPLAGKMGTKPYHECEPLHLRPKLGGISFY